MRGLVEVEACSVFKAGPNCGPGVYGRYQERNTWPGEAQLGAFAKACLLLSLFCAARQWGGSQRKEGDWRAEMARRRSCEGARSGQGLQKERCQGRGQQREWRGNSQGQRSEQEQEQLLDVLWERQALPCSIRNH